MKIGLAAAAMIMAVTGVAASAQEQPEAPKPEKKICHTQLATGSRVRKTRICMTAEEWRAQNSNTQQGIDRITRESALPQQSSNPLGG